MKKILTVLFVMSLAVKLFAQPAAIANFVVANETAKVVCNKSTIEFINTSNDSIINTYVWDFGDKSKKDTTYDIATNVKHTFNKDGKYTVILTIIDTSNNDTVLSQKKRIDVVKIYNPDIQPFTSKFDEFQTYNYTFSNPTTFKPFDASAWTYVWDFGDGDIEGTDSTSIYHHFTEEGKYNVILKAKLKDDVKLSNNKTAECFDTVTVEIIVKDGFFKTDSSNKKMPLIPNVFTPNSDGTNDEMVLSTTDTTTINALNENDIFVFKTNGEQTFRFWVYNKWGGLVYKVENKTISWNGKTSSGEDVNSGVYYYVVESDATDKKRHKAAGVIHVYRE